MPSAARAAAAGSCRVSTPGGAAARRAMGIPRPPEDCRNRAKTLATNIIRAFVGWHHALLASMCLRVQDAFRPSAGGSDERAFPVGAAPARKHDCYAPLCRDPRRLLSRRHDHDRAALDADQQRDAALMLGLLAREARASGRLPYSHITYSQPMARSRSLSRGGPAMAI